MHVYTVSAQVLKSRARCAGQSARSLRAWDTDYRIIFRGARDFSRFAFGICSGYLLMEAVWNTVHTDDRSSDENHQVVHCTRDGEPSSAHMHHTRCIL